MYLVMICECRYDKNLDIQEVDQFGYVNLREAYVTGIVPGTIEMDEQSFDVIDDLNALQGGKPRDVFDAITAGKAIVAANASKETED